MAKRTSSTTDSQLEVSRKQACREDLLQSSLFKFYKPRDDSAEKLRPSTAPLTPASFNIHIYSQSDIEKACGLNQQRLRFWNDKAADICADRSAVRELGNSREAIEVLFIPPGLSTRLAYWSFNWKNCKRKQKRCMMMKLLGNIFLPLPKRI